LCTVIEANMITKIFKALSLSSFICLNLISQPKLSLDKMEIDLGKIYSGMKKKGTVILKNIGNEPLNIISVVAQCGCTAVKHPKPVLQPGESDAVEVEFNSSSYRGSVEKYINITTNDSISQNVAIKLVAEVKEELEPTNHSVLMWFGNVELGKTSTQKTALKNISDHPIKILGSSVSSSTTVVKVEKKTLKPGEIIEIEVTVRPEKIGYNNDHFTIQTDSNFQPLVELRVSFLGAKEN